MLRPDLSKRPYRPPPPVRQCISLGNRVTDVQQHHRFSPRTQREAGRGLGKDKMPKPMQKDKRQGEDSEKRVKENGEIL